MKVSVKVQFLKFLLIVECALNNQKEKAQIGSFIAEKLQVDLEYLLCTNPIGFVNAALLTPSTCG